jgi:CheY-like chemotaxis protein
MEKYILMIDDDLDDYMVLNEILAKYPGLRCHYACNAATGIEMMEEHVPDAVLLDMNMPGMNGLDCLKMIMGNPALAQVPVIIFSTSISETLRLATLKLGAKRCLHKPSVYEGYKEVLTELLGVMDTDGQQFACEAI